MEFDAKIHNLEVKTLQLIDISSEDDYLIDFPFRNSLEDLRLSVTFEKTNSCDGLEQFWNADNESELHQQKDHMISEFEEPKRPSFLRRSLAWDSEFFTSEGVLDLEELILINKGFKKAEVPQLPRIQENVCGCRSVDSKSTLTASKKVISRSQNKLDSVSASKSECLKPGSIVHPIISQRTARSKESTMLSPKPPRISSPTNPISAEQRVRASLGSETVQMDRKSRKTRSGPDLKVSKKSRLRDLSVPISTFTPPRKLDSSVFFMKNSTACCPSYDSGSSASSSKYSSKSTRLGKSSGNSRLGPTKRPTTIYDTATASGSYSVYNVTKSTDLQCQEIEEGKFTSVSADTKRSGKSSGLRKPSPKFGFFDKDQSTQPEVREWVGFHFSGPTSEKKMSRIRAAKTIPDPDVFSPAMERGGNSMKARMGERLRKKVLSRNKMSVDGKKENDKSGHSQGGRTNYFLNKHKEREKENICKHEDEVSGLSRYLEGVDLNREMVIEGACSRTPLADKTCLSNRGGLFGRSA